MDAIDNYLSDHGISAEQVRLLRRPVDHWIGGAAVQQGEPLPVFEPSTGVQLCAAQEGGAEMVDAAVRAAQAALTDPDWAGLRPLDRQALILKLADVLEAHDEELALIESVDVGKPVAVAQEVDIGGSLDVLRYFAGLACRCEGRAGPMAAYPASHFGMTLKAPVGVVGAIVPWNFPLQTLIWKTAAALAAGCTLVIKPSEITPLSALRFAELATEAGFPAGVINVVNGTGPVTGVALVAHPAVAKITFTGSTEAGRRVGKVAMENMKRVTLELGGKSPVLVTARADLDLAVEGVVNGIFFNSGQVCDAGSRVIVQSAIHDDFLARLVERT
ncbi:MAG: aldehyde dehydrogenase family protein, partial [Silicimonas sp.]|nr:aldehyde dehydrogenase family protein [Silicimonas sp.]